MYIPAVKMSETPCVTVISATKSIYQNEREYRKLRVCAYGRVSTEKEEQASSIVAQKSYFLDKIYSNPDWEFAGYFEDEGISGKSIEQRDGFQDMIDKCEQGKIDLILTKSVSRFSRNIVDSISTARLLKEFGVEVSFDQDGFRTFEPDAEMRLTVMSLMAQEEIMRQSKSVKFGQFERVKNGKISYNYVGWYGYKKGTDGKPEIVPKEALVVEKIFSDYISGESLEMIAKALNKKNIPTRENAKWTKATVKRILENCKYCGNFLYGKTFKPDPLAKKAIKNTGQSEQVWLRMAHDGIVTEETFNLANAEIKRRNDVRVVVENSEKLSKYSSKYALNEKLYCAECKSSFRRKVWKRKDGSDRPMWICKSAMGRNSDCNTKGIDEYRLHGAIVAAVNRYNKGSQSISEMLSKNIMMAISSDNLGINPHTLKNEIAMLERGFSDLITLSIKSNQPELFEDKFREIADKIEFKKKQYEELEATREEENEFAEKLRLVQEYVDKTPEKSTEYDDTLVRQIISRIGIYKDEKLKIVFIDGTEMMENLPPKIR